MKQKTSYTISDGKMVLKLEAAEEGGYIGYVAELPGANTQGETLEEVRENLSEAIQLILEANREQFERQFNPDSKVTREQLVLRAA